MKNAYKFSQPIVLGPAASDPSGAVNGAVYYNTADNKFKVYENGTWKAIVTGTVDLTGYLKADGSVPLTANWNVGGFKLTNLAAPTDDNDAARKIYVDTAISTAIGAIPATDLTPYLKKDGTVAMTGSLLPATNFGADLGGTGKYWNNIHGMTGKIYNIETEGLSLVSAGVPKSIFGTSLSYGDSFETADVGLKINQGNFALFSQENSDNDGADTGSITVQTGSKSSGTGYSGRIKLKTGTSAGGLRGDIVLDGREIDASYTKITKLANGTTAADAVNKSQLDGAISGLSSVYVPLSEKGAALGVATLDAGGKVPASQLPSTLMEYLGVWNASTNTPTLADGVGDTGNVYRVSVAGTQNLGSGSISFEVGDYVIYNGTVWEKSDTTDAVASVNGKQGVVTLVTDDIAEDGSPINLWFTDTRAKAAAVVNTLAGNETDQAPSVSAVKTELGNYLKKDGTVAMTGALNMGGSLITNATAVNTGRVVVNGLIEEIAFSKTCAVGTTVVDETVIAMDDYEGFELSYTIRSTATGEKRLGTVRAIYSTASGVSFSDTYTETDALPVSMNVTYSSGEIFLSTIVTGSSVVMNGSLKNFRKPV